LRQEPDLELRRKLDGVKVALVQRLESSNMSETKLLTMGIACFLLAGCTGLHSGIKTDVDRFQGTVTKSVAIMVASDLSVTILQVRKDTQVNYALGVNISEAYQRSFLCRQAFGAYHTAKSYWILRKKRCFNDCNGLGRNLLESIANSVVGAKSPTHAVELIAYELSEKIRHAEQWKRLPEISAEFSAELQQVIDKHQAILPTFLALINKAKAPDWKFYRRFEVAGLPGYYRSGYFNFSRYTHAGYEVQRPGRNTSPSRTADFVALAAPVLTAANYHAHDCEDCSQGNCSLRDESMLLLKQFSSQTIGKKAKIVRG
jgi:hypothetical protein